MDHLRGCESRISTPTLPGIVVCVCLHVFGKVAHDIFKDGDQADETGTTIIVGFSFICFFGYVGAGIWAAAEGWGKADQKYSRQAPQPWRWPLLRARDIFHRSPGDRCSVRCCCPLAAYVVVGLLSFTISSDTDAKKVRGP